MPKSLWERIYQILGQQVMFDHDSAEIYGYTTSAFNQQVARNIKKFRARISCFVYHPYAFTEQGIYMLMTVLRGDLATKQSRALIRMFRYNE